ncbi:U5 snRNP-specific protein-like factor [Handroanthus impetiginosus]|uniref:U5 snRNP-specific protein-like factor n=1 Tax=Handroanthus impetiginosus TaxID=429701 RepID=A0A2G9HGQ6_9LAMI|nr:U5 snRNP-specific protein-like factor [Handroanthus impetiginosus]
MSGYHLMKKPKIEIEEREEEEPEEEEPEEEPEEEEPEEEEPEEENNDGNDGYMDEQIRNEQEEALVALIEHRTKEVEHLRQRIKYYKSQLDEAEKRLQDTQNKLARLRGRNNVKASKNLTNGREELKVERISPSPIKMSESSSQKQSQLTPSRPNQETMKPSGDNLNVSRRTPSPFHRSGDSSQNQTQSRPQLVIPAVTSNMSQPTKTKESGNKASGGSGSLPTSSAPTHVNSLSKLKGEHKTMETQPNGTKKKLEQREHEDLIKLISKSSSPVTIRCQTGCLLSSQHKRKLRSLVLCPTNDQLFVTSALDGVVNLWQVQGRGSTANLLSSTDCQSDKQRRWPEDIAWHPRGNKLFSVYNADGGDSQISLLNLNKGKERTRVSFLQDKPHIKGIINSITFMPWDDKSFVTGGSDHGVIIWTEKDGEDSWKPKTLHRGHHSSAVMGVAGMHHRDIVMSAGADKRIIGFDVLAGRTDYKHQIESKCMSVLPNPRDFNLFMVQTGTPERQLRLYDLRLRQMEIHAFGWKQESSESQSALINQAWSPDGLYMTSGSADPVIHIFDIRFNSHKPSQSIRAHQKRVFKAAWHHALPLLISISSDLNIGLHKIT